MAGNVFGNPITDDDVRILYPNITEITPKIRAEVAFRNITTKEGIKMRKLCEKTQERYGDGISALCMIFNAPEVLNLHRQKDWHGHVYESPYPAKIQNGQWGAFLHVHPSWLAGSEAAVIYRGHNNDGALCDWMLSWGIPYVGDNHAYTEIREGRHYETDHWNYIQGLLESQSTEHEDTWNGCYSIVTIGEGTSPEYVGIMALDGVTTKQ
ncbi:hypothetical protein FEM48_ZijujUnG0098900 [Ziziphus jujuba var. spinosa]|uniref:23 kDa jasmonate-induced protein-like n=1 Tax=Ziziphus jujuba var. spinosa TaxID=714518 RepID=A0A978U8B1_ZIZJJ|nr:hypothetical protein FEM48_ZijujUnG0098900 [Ziziphus jujuba var. spinosa]